MGKVGLDKFAKSKMLKILIPYPRLNDGCSWYRINQWVDATNRLGLANGVFLKPSFTEDEIGAIVKAADIIVYRFNDKSPAMLQKVRRLYPKKPIVIDTDDDLFNINPLNNAYESMGTREVQLPDGTWLWKDGKARFDLYENKKRMIDYEMCLRRSDAIITTTMRLANNLKKFNEAVVIIPNSINFHLFPQITIKKEKGRLDLVWAGGSSHYPDLAMIGDGLRTLAKKYPNLHFHLVGMEFGAIRKMWPHARYHFWRWLPPEGHGFRLATIGADVAIAPLEDKVFNWSKSCIKWYEYAAVGIPTVASRVPPYSDEIQDGETGYLFRSNDEFVEKVSELLENPIERTRIANNAYKWVRGHRDVDVVVKDWVKFLTGLVEARNG